MSNEFLVIQSGKRFIEMHFLLLEEVKETGVSAFHGLERGDAFSLKVIFAILAS